MWQSHGQQTIYMALAAVKSDRRTSPRPSHSLALAVCPPLARLRGSSAFDMRNLFENFIAFHARTIWLESEACRLLLVLFMMLPLAGRCRMSQAAPTAPLRCVVVFFISCCCFLRHVLAFLIKRTVKKVRFSVLLAAFILCLIN